jgi:hypothetical protein
MFLWPVGETLYSWFLFLIDCMRVLWDEMFTTVGVSKRRTTSARVC